MQYETNFQRFNKEAAGVKTKDFNGTTLVWSEEDGRFILPMPEKSKFKFVFDEDSGTIVQVVIKDPDFYYHETASTAADGSTTRNRVYFGKNNGEAIPDPEHEKALIDAKVLQMRKTLIYGAGAALSLTIIGGLVSIGYFFYYLIVGIEPLVASFTTGSVLAMTEIGYYGIWVVGFLVVGLVLKFGLPFLLSSNEDDNQEPRTTSGSPQNDASVNITVNQNTGAGNGAQAFVNNRDL